MSDDEPDTNWDEVVDDLTQRASPGEPVPEDARERMWSTIASEFELAPADAGDAETGGTDADGADGSVPAEGAGEASAGGALSESTGAAGTESWLAGWNLWNTVISLFVGASMGAGGYALLDGSRTQQKPVDGVDTYRAPVVADTGPDADADSADAGHDTTDTSARLRDADIRNADGSAPKPDPAPVEPPERATPPEATPDTGSAAPDTASIISDDVAETEGTLSAERLLLSRAHAALGRERPSEALRALDEHARRFPDGHLAEERRALKVRSLFAAGETTRARRLAREFLDEHPNSIFQGQMKQLLRTSQPDAQGTTSDVGPTP